MAKVSRQLLPSKNHDYSVQLTDYLYQIYFYVYNNNQ